MSERCAPAEGTERWTHHWIGPKDGDSEPWIWTDNEMWARASQTLTPVDMAKRGWVYVGPCVRPEVVADLRRRLDAAEARAGEVIVPSTRRASKDATP